MPVAEHVVKREYIFTRSGAGPTLQEAAAMMECRFDVNVKKKEELNSLGLSMIVVECEEGVKNELAASLPNWNTGANNFYIPTTVQFEDNTAANKRLIAQTKELRDAFADTLTVAADEAGKLADSMEEGIRRQQERDSSVFLRLRRTFLKR